MDLDFFFRFNPSSFFEREKNMLDPTLRYLEKKDQETAKGPPKRIPSSHLKRLTARKKLQQKTKSTKRDPNIKLHPLLYENNGSLDRTTHQSLKNSTQKSSNSHLHQLSWCIQFFLPSSGKGACFHRVTTRTAAASLGGTHVNSISNLHCRTWGKMIHKNWFYHHEIDYKNLG